MLAAGSQRAHGQTPPLSISLDAPVTCETDAPGWTIDAPEIEFDTVAIGWSVSGGAPPYEVLIDGKAFSGDSGTVEVACGRLARRHGSITLQITSGVSTIQATVTDADRRSATALHDLHSIRVIRQQGNRPPDLFGGGTYRIHGPLLTVPVDYRMTIGRYVSADCPTRDHTCADRFSLSLYNTDGFGYFEGSISLYRWSGAEHSRTLDGSTGRSPVTILADDPDTQIPSYQKWVSDLFDEFLATLGQPPAPRPDVRAGGPARADRLSDPDELRDGRHGLDLLVGLRRHESVRGPGQRRT